MGIDLAAFMGKVVALLGAVNLIAAVVAHDDARPGVAWILAFFGLSMLLGGAAMWLWIDNRRAHDRIADPEDEEPVVGRDDWVEE